MPVPVGMVGVEGSGTEGETVPAEVELAASPPVIGDVVSCAGVEVEETNGGAFWMYEPSAWTA